MFEFMTNLSNGKRIDRRVQAATEGDPYEHYLSGFWRIDPADLRDVESELGYSLPEQLSAFYSEIGVGTVRSSKKIEGLSYNNVLFPWDMGKLIAGTCAWADPDIEIEPDVLPFFERDVGLFLCVRPESEQPNAVHWMWGDKICDSVVEFFQRVIVDPDWFNPTAP